MDRESFDKLMTRYMGLLMIYRAERLGQFRYLAEDTAQDVMLVMVKRRAALKTEADVKSYIYRVADKCILHNSSREAARLKKLVSYDVDTAPDAETFDKDCIIALASEDLTADLCERLPEEDRELFRLRFIDKKTIEAIAKETSTPYSTVRLHIEKIKQHVKKVMEKN